MLGPIGKRVVERMVGMKFPGPEFRVKVFRGEELGLDARDDGPPWAEYRGDIVSVGGEMGSKMGGGDDEAVEDRWWREVGVVGGIAPAVICSSFGEGETCEMCLDNVLEAAMHAEAN